MRRGLLHFREGGSGEQPFIEEGRKKPIEGDFGTKSLRTFGQGFFRIGERSELGHNVSRFPTFRPPIGSSCRHKLIPLNFRDDIIVF